MHYQAVREARFVSRPNRFVAIVRDPATDRELPVHVKNTGRCRELLVPGATVYLAHSDHPKRVYPDDLIAVRKGERLINMDSSAPNAVGAEYLPTMIPGLDFLRREMVFRDARIDLFATRGTEKWLVEVKGVTLEEGESVYFPDAPTVRGTHHLRVLQQAVADGYRAALLLVVQMENAAAFYPNGRTDPDFARELRAAAAAGVMLRAVTCRVTPDSLEAGREIPVFTEGGAFDG